MPAASDLTEERATVNAATCYVVLPTDTFGGHENMLIEWLGEARRRGLAIKIHCKDITELTRRCQGAGFQPDVSHYVVEFRGSRFARTCRDLLATWRILGSLPRDGAVLLAPGVVQASPMHLVVAILRRRRVVSYVPMAYDSHVMRFCFAAIRDRLIRGLVRHVSAWVTITEQQRKLLFDQWRVTVPVHVVPNRLSLPGIPARGASSRNANDPLRVLFLGRFERNQKGLDWLCEQLRLHRNSWVGRMRFTFQGQGEFEPHLRQLSLACGKDAICLASWGDAAHELQRTDVLLLPSRFEGLPLVALEATHYGVPIVASNQAGLSDILPLQSLFAFGDFDCMRIAIERFSDAQAGLSAVAHAQARIRRFLSVERFEQSVSAVVREIAALSNTGESKLAAK